MRSLQAAVAASAALCFIGGCAVKTDHRTGDPGSATGAPVKVEKVQLFYATDRRPTGQQSPARFYSGDRIAPGSEVEFGTCDITIPPGHRRGKLEEYRWYRFEAKNNAARHVTITSVVPQARAAVLDQLRAVMDQAQEKELLVFIHGFNITWDESARRAGQIAYDIDLAPSRGAPFLFSWASQGEPADYFRDETSVRTAALRLRGVLTNLVASSGARRVNILAHSMGNQALNVALQLIGEQNPAHPLFEQVVMAAPDVDVDYLLETAPTLRTTARQFTIYSCRKDIPLWFSSRLFGRDGRVGSFALIDGFDTIDTTRVEMDSILNHSYIGESPMVLRDLAKLMRYGCDVASRCCCCFKSVPDASGRIYWTFRESTPLTCTHTQACGEGSVEALKR